MSEPQIIIPSPAPDVQRPQASGPSSEMSLPPLEISPWPVVVHQEDADKPWYSLTKPPELREVPKDEQFAEELHNIIAWSLKGYPAQGRISRDVDLPTEKCPHSTTAVVAAQGSTRTPRTPDDVEDLSPLEKAIETNPAAPDGSTTPETLPRPAAKDLGHSASALSIQQNYDNERSTFQPCVDPAAEHDHQNQNNSKVDEQKGSGDRVLEKIWHRLGVKSCPTKASSELEEGLEQATRRKAARVAKEKEKRRTVECTSCFDDIVVAKSTTLPCSHAYCTPCFATLIRTAIQYEQSFPPKCCLTEVPLQTVLLALDSSQRIEYKSKAAEYAISPAERLYCPGSTCQKFIPPTKIVRRSNVPQKCPHCSLKICRVCRGEAHAGQEDCPEDYGLNAALESAENEGWQRCYRCRTLVELTYGCRHMTCSCKAEFCYVCGLRWQTCACTEADLVNRRADIVRRRGERLQREAAQNDAAIEEEQEIARAIAEVEEFERTQVAARAAERRRQEQEQREEEELLARLEAMSLEEQRRRQEAEALAEKQRLAVLRFSVIEHAQSLNQQLQTLVAFQQHALISRQEGEEYALKQKIEQNIEGLSQNSQHMQELLTKNAQTRRAAMLKRHQKKSAALQGEHEAREDAMFLQMQTYLHGKPNREEREKRIQSNFQDELVKEREEQMATDSAEWTEFETRFQQELRWIGKSYETGVQQIQEKNLKDLQDLNCRIHGERQYFDFIIKRRTRLMAHHSRLLIADFEESREPVGLTRDMAIAVLTPFPVEYSIEPGTTTSVPNAASADEVSPTQTTAMQSPDPGSLQVALPLITGGTMTTSSSSISSTTRSQEPHDLRTTTEATLITITSNSTSSTTSKRRRSSIWSGFGRSKDKSKEKYTNEQIQDMLRRSVGDAF